MEPSAHKEGKVYEESVEEVLQVDPALEALEVLVTISSLQSFWQEVASSVSHHSRIVQDFSSSK